MYTRHNIGFLVVEALAEKWGLTFQSKPKLEALLAKGEFEKQTVFLLKPQTFMNLSGLAVKKAMQFYKIKRGDVLVISDEAALDFDTMKLNPKGGAGGHNGLKNIQGHLGPDYPRLRMGIGAPKRSQLLEDYVLDRFSLQEMEGLGAFIQDALEIIECWLEKGLERAMNQANEKKVN